MNAFKPSALLDPVKQQLDQLKNRLKENVDPAKALAPLEPPFNELMAAFDSLKPDEIVKPLQDGIDSAVNAVFSAIPIDATFHEVDEALAKVQDAAAIGDRLVSVLQRVAHGAGGLRRRAGADVGVARADPVEGRRGRRGRVAHARSSPR